MDNTPADMTEIFTPVQHLKDPFLLEHGVNLYVKRDDYLGVHCQGIKYRKLKYVIEYCKKKKHTKILSFGTMLSNHLYALAALGQQHGIGTIGMLDGVVQDWIPFIKGMQEFGMHLHPLKRREYRERETRKSIRALKKQYPGAYIFHPDKSHKLVLAGIGEMVDEVKSQIDVDIDYWTAPYIHGETALGIAKKLGRKDKLDIYAFRRKIEEDTVRKKISRSSKLRASNIGFTKAILRGENKKNRSLEEFIRNFYDTNGIILDPQYSGRLFSGIYRNVRDGVYKDCNILAVHCGGYISIKWYNKRYRMDMPDPLPDFVYEEE